MARFGRLRGAYFCLVFMAWLLVWPIQGQEAYAEGKKVSGSAKSVTPMSLDRIPLPDKITCTDLRIEHWVLSSADRDWNNAHVFYVRYDHPTKFRVIRGYSAITHPGGDQTFIKYEAKVEVTGAGGYNLEAKGRYIAGTGRFKGITGSWTATQEYTQAGILAEWDTEYEIK